MIVSIIVPVRNEEKYIENCIKSILSFELPKKIRTEIFIIDGMSTDNTRKILNDNFINNKKIYLLDNLKKNQSSALNIGIKKSKGDYILRLDAHTNYPNDYLKNILETNSKFKADNIGGVCITQPGGKNIGALIVQALTTHKFGVGNSSFRVGYTGGYVDTVPFGFFKKSIFDKIGLFDERLIRAQDYEFNSRIILNGGKIYLNPKIKCDYYTQKFFYNFLTKYFKMEGPYNAYMWFLYPYTFSIRHTIPLLFSLGIIFGLLLSLFSINIMYIYVSVILLYFFLALISSIQQSINFKNLRLFFLLPFSFFLFHFFYGLGIFFGIIDLFLGKGKQLKNRVPY